MCLVVAPAGWGKTTLLTEWARHAGDRESVAWVTLDEADDEPHRFWTYVPRLWSGPRRTWPATRWRRCG